MEHRALFYVKQELLMRFRKICGCTFNFCHKCRYIYPRWSWLFYCRWKCKRLIYVNWNNARLAHVSTAFTSLATA